MNVSLTSDEADLIERSGLLPSARLGHGEGVAIRSRAVVVELDEDEADSLRDACIERQQEVGFDRDYNLTAAGVVLQCLIDRLYR